MWHYTLYIVIIGFGVFFEKKKKNIYIYIYFVIFLGSSLSCYDDGESGTEMSTNSCKLKKKQYYH